MKYVVDLTPWDIEQISTALKYRATILRSEALFVERAVKQSGVGDEIRVAARHIDELVQKFEKI